MPRPYGEVGATPMPASLPRCTRRGEARLALLVVATRRDMLPQQGEACLAPTERLGPPPCLLPYRDVPVGARHASPCWWSPPVLVRYPSRARHASPLRRGWGHPHACFPTEMYP